MTLVTLSNDVTLNSDFVVSAVIGGANDNRVIVRMCDGETYSLPCLYGKSIFASRDHYVDLLNGEIP